MRAEDLDATESIGVSAKSLESQLSDVMTGFAATVSRKKFALNAADVAELRKIAELSDLIKKHANNILSTAETRRANLIQSSGINFVSLGADCFPRTLATRWGLKKTAKLGELTHPFDLAIHPSEAVRSLLNNRFTGYFDGGLRFDEKLNYCIHPAMGVELNHEFGYEFAENDFQKLRDKYASRSINFDRAMSDDNRVVFIHHTDTIDRATIETVKDIFEIVSKRREGRETAFVWIYTPPFETGTQSNRKLGENVAFIQTPYPFKNYVWHNPKHTFSLRGVRFEKKIVEQIAEFLQLLNWRQVETR